MRHHSTSIIGPDIDESNYPATPDSCPDPAQPSVGERLGRIAENVYFNTSMEGETLWDEVALAARREVLKEGFAEEDTEAAAKAFWNATLPGIAWDELREASRKPIRVQAAAALSAALASRVARAEREDK